MIEKVDAVIVSRHDPRSYMELARVLNDASWVNRLHIETSYPLSLARANVLKSCSSEWIAEFDDDVTIPDDWLFRIQDGVELTDDVLALSSVYTDVNPHIWAYTQAANLFRNPSEADTPYICNLLIRKSVLEKYHPPECFFCEDDLLYKFVVDDLHGKWIRHPDIGVTHTLKWRSYSGVGVSFRKYKFFTKSQIVKSIVARFGVGFLAMFYSKNPKTTYLYWKKNFEIMWGYFFGK